MVLSYPKGAKISMPCPYCHSEVYAILTKAELKRIMKGFKMRTDVANRLLHLKVNERGFAEWQR